MERKVDDDVGDTGPTTPSSYYYSSTLTLYLSMTSSSSPSRIPLVITIENDPANVDVGFRRLTSSTLRRRIHVVTCVPLESMRLIYRGRVISGGGGGAGGGDMDAVDVISEYDLVDGCVIHVVGRPSTMSSSVASATSASSPPRPPSPLHSAIESVRRDERHHPGLLKFYDWRSCVGSLYRIYAIPCRDDSDDDRNDGEIRYRPATLPMSPSSERGRVQVYLEVTNRTSKHDTIDVYWIDHNGNEVRKGSIRRGGDPWTQYTYIGHPWTFRVGPTEEGVLLRYVPFRIVSSIVGSETLHDKDGAHRFAFRDVPDGFIVRNGGDAAGGRGGRGTIPVCWVDDKILPEAPPVPRRQRPDVVTSKEIRDAVAWSCRQIRREDAVRYGNGIASARLLMKYLQNIRAHPDESKYRRIRIGNRAFQRCVYDTGARGVLLALGFVESYGNMQCGMTTTDWVRQTEDAIVIVNETLRIMESGIDAALVQPEGGDGYGRAGFGRACEMNI